MKKKKPRCAICGSKRFSKDANTGRIICDEGHLQQNYLVESAERDINTAGLTYRKTRKQRKAKKTAAPSSYYQGEKSRFLMFQTGQLLLRQQIHAIMELWQLPSELEIVARDLWAMYVSATDLAPEPHLAQQDQKEAQAKLDKPKPSSPNLTGEDIDHLFNSTSASENDAPDQPSDEDTDPSESDPEPEDVDPQPNQIGPSIPQPYAGPTRARRRGASTKETLDPANVFHAHFTLAICYLSCLYIRAPVFMHDVLELAAVGSLPYIGFAMTLPPDMRKIMPRSVRSVFMPPDVLPVLYGTDESISFHAWISKFMKLYLRYGVTFPTVNVSPLLARCCRHMLLPPPFYHAAKRLLHHFDYDFTFLTEEPAQHLIKGRNDGPLNMSLLSPDSLIAGGLLLAVKLQWGLDDQPRHVDPEQDSIAPELPTQKAWLKALEERIKSSQSNNISELVKKDIAAYDEDELDAYLDFCQDMLVQEERIDGNGVPTRFPLPEPARVDRTQESNERLLESLRKMYDPRHRMPTANDQSQVMCGEDIIYSAKTKAAPEAYRAYETVRCHLAQYSGYTPPQLDRVVRTMEDRLVAEMGSKVGRRAKRKVQRRKPRTPMEDEWIEDSDEEALADDPSTPQMDT